MAFSGGVKLGDLDDFIALSQDCVKPLIQAAEGSASAKLQSVSEARAVPVAEVPLVQRPNLIKTKQSASDPKAQIGQVTLSDCLACSGCVTSAETVLLQEQSGEEFLKRAGSAPITVVSISSEARTSLASSLGSGPLSAMQVAAEGLRKLGATYVLECSAAEAVALLEGKAEFVRRYRYASETFGGSSGSRPARGQKQTAAPSPFLTSHCPGWTLYAEKVVDPGIIPHLSPIRPPQEVQGRLVKTFLLEAHNRRRFFRWWRVRSPLFAAESWWWLRPLIDVAAPSPLPLSPGDVYHVSVQPCYDRKIEAARPNFTTQGPGSAREVDTVLTTAELLELLQVSPEEDLRNLPRCPLNSEVLTDLRLGSLQEPSRPAPLLCTVRANAGSGGFLEYIFKEAANDLFHIDIFKTQLDFKTKQNDDMREVILEDQLTKKILMRFTAAYGFRNIQNVIRRSIKASETADGSNPSFGPFCDFVEIMACPGGCLNGGGQIRSKQSQEADGQTTRRMKLSEMEAMLTDGEGTAYVSPQTHPLTLQLYRYIVQQASAGATGTLEKLRLESLVGSEDVRSWLAADWRSLRVDSEGKQVVTTSALKW